MDRWTPLPIFASDHNFPEYARLIGLYYKEVEGFYGGEREGAFSVAARWFTAIAAAGILRGQETVLFLSGQEPVFNGKRRASRGSLAPDGQAVPDNGWTDLGIWTSVSKTEALANDAWTYDPLDNQHYITALLPPASFGHIE